MVFYDANLFPSEFKGSAFVAFHGSGPYGNVDGYKVVRVKFANGKPIGGYEDFVTGLWSPGRNTKDGLPSPIVWGTPAGLVVANDGSLLIADENAVWRVSYVGNKQ